MTHIVAINCYMFFQQNHTIIYDAIYFFFYEIYDPFSSSCETKQERERAAKGRKAIKIKFMFNFFSSHSQNNLSLSILSGSLEFFFSS